MSLMDRLAGWFGWRDPAPTSPLKPMLQPTPFVIPDQPPAPPHPDLVLVRATFALHERHNPGLTWSSFMTLLVERHRFFATERQEREARLAELQPPRTP